MLITGAVLGLAWSWWFTRTRQLTRAEYYSLAVLLVVSWLPAALVATRAFRWVLVPLVLISPYLLYFGLVPLAVPLVAAAFFPRPSRGGARVAHTTLLGCAGLAGILGLLVPEEERLLICLRRSEMVEADVSAIYSDETKRGWDSVDGLISMTGGGDVIELTFGPWSESSIREVTRRARQTTGVLDVGPADTTTC